MKLSDAKKLLKNMRENCLAENKPYKDPKRKEKAEALHIALNALSGAEPDYAAVYNAALKEANEEWVEIIGAKIEEIEESKIVNKEYIIDLLENLLVESYERGNKNEQF